MGRKVRSVCAVALATALAWGGVVTGTASAAPHDWSTPIGAIGSSKDGKTHGCSGSVVHSGHHDVVMTAAHCMYGRNKDSVWFYPHYHNGAPDGQYGGSWAVSRIVIPPNYSKWRQAHPNPDPGHQHRTNPYDFAFLVLKPNNGKNVEDLTGSLYPEVKVNAHNTPTTATGYNSGSGNLSSCRGGANGTKYQGNWYVRVDCPGLGGGTSGGPFVKTNTYSVIGLMGGYEEGGDTSNINYSAWFQDDFVSAYNDAQRG